MLNNIYNSIKNKIYSHKIMAGGLVIVLFVAGYYGYGAIFGAKATTQYVLATVQKGTIITSISGSGQVSTTSQVDVKPKIAGDVVYVAAKNGQVVKAGALLAQIDTTDAQKTVRDAQLALDNAKISLEKFKIDQGSSQQTRTDTLKKNYDDGFNQVAGAYSDLVDIVTGANGVLYDDVLKGSCSPNVCQYQNYFSEVENLRTFNNLSRIAVDDFTAAKKSYDTSLEQYRGMRLLDTTPDTLKPMLDNTLLTLRLIAQAVKSEQNMMNNIISYLNDKNNSNASAVPAAITTYQKNLASYTTTLNSRISSVSSSINSINSQEQNITSGTLGDPLDLSNQENTVAQKQAALQDAQKNLADCYVRAPFSGIVTKVNVNKGDSISSGTAVATLITNQQVAELSLNEVDVSKIKIGQKTTLTFDAIDGLTIAGKVLEIDTLGTVSQGVVTYNVKIGFDSQADSVKSGMSVSAAIITDAKADVLMVPNSAIKTQNNQTYIEMSAVPPATPKKVNVTVGLTNDTETEILSGLAEGDQIISRTITSTTTTTQATQNTGNILRGGLGR